MYAQAIPVLLKLWAAAPQGAVAILLEGREIFIFFELFSIGFD
jgi:hypothetical protein